ncbi:hypothetical protein Hanom_Chr01g00026141 [Helianthus anomalus]
MLHSVFRLRLVMLGICVFFSVYDAMLRHFFFNACMFSCFLSVRVTFKLSETVCTLILDIFC